MAKPKRYPAFTSINDSGLAPSAGVQPIPMPYGTLTTGVRTSPTKIGPALPPVPGKKPALRGRELALTRGKGKKVGLKKQSVARRSTDTPPSLPKIGLPRSLRNY